MVRISFFLSVLLVAACTVPMAPEPEASERFEPNAKYGRELQITPLFMGKQTVPLCAAAGEASCFETVESVHVAYLLHHPEGNVLIDAGVSAAGPDEAASFPFPRNMALDYQHERGLREALDAHGGPKIDWVILTHAHWDHTSGLPELDGSIVLFGPDEHAFFSNHGRDHGVIPEHFEAVSGATVKFDGPAFENFPSSFDLFDDGAIVLVPMQGHTPGSIGVFATQVNGRRLLFVGDAVWNTEAIRIPSHKHRLTSKLADFDAGQLSQQLWRLHRLYKRYPELVFVPTHDGGALETVRKLAQ